MAAPRDDIIVLYLASVAANVEWAELMLTPNFMVVFPTFRCFFYLFTLVVNHQALWGSAACDPAVVPPGLISITVSRIGLRQGRGVSGSIVHLSRGAEEEDSGGVINR